MCTTSQYFSTLELFKFPFMMLCYSRKAVYVGIIKVGQAHIVHCWQVLNVLML